jgi:hypothetical protein
VNPAFILQNWGAAEPRLTIDGKSIARGPNFRYGFVPKLEGTDLIVWLAMESTEPARLVFTHAK